MVIRACVAALDWNYNINRQQKKSKTGELQYKKKVNTDFPIEMQAKWSTTHFKFSEPLTIILKSYHN